MAHFNINNRQEMMEYALRALGHPVIQINVDAAQLNDRIDDALDLFWEYHNEGTEQVFIHYQVTQDDVDRGYMKLPDEVTSVTDVILVDGTGTNGIAGINLSYQMFITDLMNVRRILQGGLSNYYVSMQHLNTITQTFNPRKRLTFNCHHSRLKILGGTPGISVGDWIAIEAYVIIDPEQVSQAWSSRWLKKYVIAQFKKQWGDNLIKYGGAQLPGGVVLNAEQIYNDGRQDCKDLEEELRNNYEYPVDFMVG